MAEDNYKKDRLNLSKTRTATRQTSGKAYGDTKKRMATTASTTYLFM